MENEKQFAVISWIIAAIIIFGLIYFFNNSDFCGENGCPSASEQSQNYGDIKTE